MRFEFATATRIVFGPGRVSEVGALAAGMGQHALVVTGGTVGRAEPLLHSLHEQEIATTLFSVAGEPSTESVREGTALAREAGCDLVVGFGGGSPLDAGKAIAVLLTNAGELLDYLEVIGKGRALTQPPVPFIAIPTTAGTGTEVTRNAVLASPEHHVKVSLRSPLMLPRLAVVDPELTYSLPPEITASTGLDALTQVLEPYVSPAATPITDALCREGLAQAARSLRRAYHDGGDTAAREDMAVASLFGGLALANAGLGAVHGFAGPLGGMAAAPHGALCGRLLPYVMAANIRALRARDPEGPALRRYTESAAILTGRPDAAAEEGAAWVQALCEELAVPDLATYGIATSDFPAIVEKARHASSMKGNPIVLTSEELLEILASVL